MPRWFPDSEHEWKSEKEPDFMHRAPERIALRESPAFDPRVCADCNEPARDCTCCLECGASNGCKCPSVEQLRMAGAI